MSRTFKILGVTTAIVLLLAAFSFYSFKDEQLKYPRVRKAYEEKENIVREILKKDSIDINQLRLYIRAFKAEKIIELWAKNKADEQFRLIREYDVCKTSGKAGPKRMEGDRQIPEGFYHIDRFNPSSNFYLSLGVNYPNRSDKILGKKSALGGNIFIHGSCVTIGCLPITNDQIKELYVFCVEARDKGQIKIPVTIFPAKLTNKNYQTLSADHPSDFDKLGLWENLKKGYELFNEQKTLPSIKFLESGRHQVTQ